MIIVIWRMMILVMIDNFYDVFNVVYNNKFAVYAVYAIFVPEYA